ncbi:NCS2 family nucleobase:cation symporter-2 [Georgenia soli]|uniref:NCS2 family nucleobase:cation symporter-2 n=1 Tax=Georgenia soli TaxID=638953 RepID=A0A2A9EHL2_9MICO|nr:nucleobase:cation symporter-2 family protein [Georgenia soli]PFG38323.1 NCS2 family nucleobase:cation symporter-2 [Georgenia soli]
MSTSSAVKSRHPVDEIPRLDRLFPLGLQHVLAMYAGAVAVPLIVGGALGYSPQDIAFLISADLFVAGVATLIQSIGFWRFGVRLPLMQGVTFAAVGPMIAIGNQYDITAIFGATIACGLFMIALAPVFSSILRFFPPLVTGTVIMIIGLSLMGVAGGWITNNQDTAEPRDLAFAAGTLIFIILLERFAPPAVARVSVLLGLVVGTIVAIPFGLVDWSGVGAAGWFAVITPLHFGLPTFPIAAVISMLVVGLVIMTETTGDMVAVGEIVDRPVGKRQLADGLRADGLSTMLGGFFNTFPYTAFAQNVGLVSLTRVKSRWVTAMSGVILIALGLVPKVAAIVEGVPRSVLGGAGIALFGMVVASGVRTLARVHFTNTNILVVAISVGVALMPTVRPDIYAAFPDWFQLIFDSGISAGALTAILLNLLLNPAQRAVDDAEAVQDARRITKSLNRPEVVRDAEAAQAGRASAREGNGHREREVVTTESPEADPHR